MPKPRTLISAKTGAEQSPKFAVYSNNPATVIATGLAGVETSDIQLSNDGGTTWADYYAEGSQIQLTATNTAIRINGPGLFRVDKGVTAGASGVFLATDRNT